MNRSALKNVEKRIQLMVNEYRIVYSTADACKHIGPMACLQKLKGANIYSAADKNLFQMVPWLHLMKNWDFD